MAPEPAPSVDFMVRSFRVHLGLFGVAVVGTLIAAIAGDAWWWPVLIFWGIGFVAHGALALWLTRRQRWELAFERDHLSDDQKAELEWNSQHYIGPTQ